MRTADKLLAIEEIKTLKARYFRLNDEKNWEDWLKLFTPDVTAEFPDDQPDAPPLRGAQNFVEATKALVGPARSVHHGHNPEIDVLTPTTARGIWSAQYWLEWPMEGPHPFGVRNMTAWARYYETYSKSAEGWRIASLVIRRQKVDQY
jgi:hypothetical protein